METETGVWKPEVGKTAWYFDPNNSKNIVCGEISGFSENHGAFAYFRGQPTEKTVAVRHISLLYPTAEAALASIKIFDLDGKEVVVTRAEPNPVLVDVVDLLWKFRNQEVSPSAFWIAIETMFDQGAFLDVVMKLQEIRENEGIKWVQDPWWMGRRGNLQTYASGIKEALQALHCIAFNMEIAPNPEGSARLKAAQDRFASLAAGKEDPADPSAREITTPTDKRNGDHC